MKCENHLSLLCRSYVVELSLYGPVLNEPIDKPASISTYIPMVYPKPDFGRRKIKVAEKNQFFFFVYAYLELNYFQWVNKFLSPNSWYCLFGMKNRNLD